MVFVALLPVVYGQTTAKPEFTVTGTRFLLPLFDSFNKALSTKGQAGVFKVTSRNPNATVIATATPRDLPAPQAGFKQEVLAEIVYLPVVNSKHPDLETLLSKGLTIHEMKQIFFGKDNRQNIAFESKPKFNVLTRSACAAVSFSHFVNEDVKLLINDYDNIENDSVLLDLIKADTLGISFLDPSNIYDPATGKQKDGIEVIPVDLDVNGKIDDEEEFYDTKEVLIQRLQQHAISLPSGLLAVSYPEHLEENIRPYLEWIKREGGTVIRDYGFLDVEVNRKNKK